jgi:hypothetical protein
MSYILGVHELNDPAAVKAAFDAYYRYLESVRERLPPAAFEFATARWHYDPDDHRSPHDAWVESIHITEPSSGERREQRRIDIQLRLLGSYHDGHLELSYQDVQSYSLEAPLMPAGGDRPVGHGDWLVDEIRLSERGHVMHEIRFSTGALWAIESLNVQCQWRQLAG